MKTLNCEISVFILFRYIPRSGIAASHGSSIFSYLKNLHTVFIEAAPVYISSQQCTGVPFLPHPCQHLLFVEFLMVTILTAVRWHLIAVLICISLIISDWCLASFHVTVGLLYIFLEKCLFWSSTHFLRISYLFDIELYELFIYFG